MTNQSDQPTEPAAVADLVDRYIDDQLRQAQQYENREPLDDSAAYSLHRLAARIYAIGWHEGNLVGETSARRAAARATNGA